MEIKALWEGQLPLENIVWRKQSYEYRLPKSFEAQRISHWNQHMSKYPNDYDGKLLFLRNFEFKEEKLILTVGFIRFSTILFITLNQIPLKNGLGLLGTGALILSPCKQYILVGERSRSSPYCPGLLTIPGGMLELKDLDDEPKALMREIYEEVSLPLRPIVTIIALIPDRIHTAALFLLSCKISSDDFSPHQYIHGDPDEFEDNLRWMLIDKLLELPNEKLFDPLIYLKAKFMEDRKVFY